MPSTRKIPAFALLAALFSPVHAFAVHIGGDGLGQALIYPYYTVRSSGGNPFNTYVSVTNTESVAKVVRMRFREGTAGREAGSFNLYLAPGDMWAGALMPDGDGAKVISVDRSCTEPALGVGAAGVAELPLAGNPAGGRGARDETREGYVELIEMGTIRPGSATALAVTQANGAHGDCAHVRASPSRVTADIAPPRGGMAGTLTLINVASGLDSTVNATALAALSTQPFFRPAADPYPDFDSAEVTPLSVVTTGGKRYRLSWARGIDAVTSVLMQHRTTNEYVLDSASDSLTDWVLTMPTRRLHRRADSASAPFAFYSHRPSCDALSYEYYDREMRPRIVGGIDFIPPPQPPPPALCAATTIWTVRNGADHMAALLGSAIPLTTGFNADDLNVTDTFQHGWADFTFVAADTLQAPTVPAGLSSLAGSTATDLFTGAVATGVFRVLGLPVVGFMTRSYSNGALPCDAAFCQGNYAAAFPHAGVRRIEALP